MKKVNICMITYNHERYISEAIDGILMQECDFEYELVIGEDYSTDNTRKICEQYAAKYPNKIKLLQSVNNWGMNSNFIRTVKECNSKYIALCEGDDYWTDPLKLQKQVDFLEKNKEYSLCFHRAKKISNNKIVTSSFEKIVSKTYTGMELLEDIFMPTASVMFRNNINEDYLFLDNKKIIYGDIFLWLRIASKGKLFCLEDNMSVYRIQENSVTNVDYTQNNIERIITNFKVLDATFEYKYNKSVNYILYKNYLKIVKLSVKKAKLKNIKYVFLTLIYFIKKIN